MNTELFKEFQEEIKSRILEYLPPEYEQARVEVRTMEKNNGLQLQGLCILKEGEHITPNIYLENFFEEWSSQKLTMEEVLNQIAKIQMYHEHRVSFDASLVTDLEKVKENIVGRLVNGEYNAKRLQNLPHTSFEDLAMTYHIHVVSGEIEGSVEVTNQMLKEYGMDVKELHELAMGNMERMYPLSFDSMENIMKNILKSQMMEEGMEAARAETVAGEMVSQVQNEFNLYVISNEDNLYGAAALFYPGVQEMLAEKMGGDYVVLPSSLHEVLILKAEPHLDLEAMQEMVKEVNLTQVAAKDKLSDHIYVYDAKERGLFRAGQKTEREEKRNVNFQEKLKEKKAESKAMGQVAVKTDKKKREVCL